MLMYEAIAEKRHVDWTPMQKKKKKKPITVASCTWNYKSQIKTFSRDWFLMPWKRRMIAFPSIWKPQMFRKKKNQQQQEQESR